MKLRKHDESFGLIAKVFRAAVAEFSRDDSAQGGINEVNVGEWSDVVAAIDQNLAAIGHFGFRRDDFSRQRADNAMGEGFKAARTFSASAVIEWIVGRKKLEKLFAVENPVKKTLGVGQGVGARRSHEALDSRLPQAQIPLRLPGAAGLAPIAVSIHRYDSRPLLQTPHHDLDRVGRGRFPKAPIAKGDGVEAFSWSAYVNPNHSPVPRTHCFRSWASVGWSVKRLGWC